MQQRFQEIFAICAPGLEKVTADEIESLLGCDVRVEKGGGLFAGSLEDLYRVNLWSRTASRIVVRLGAVRARDFPEFYRRLKRLPWGRFVRPETPVAARCTSRRSRLGHTGRMARTVIDAVNGALGRPENPPSGEEQLVVVRMEDDVCTVSIDSSGNLLHRRGYRTEVSRAPLRETLAAGILRLLGWTARTPLCDPMCGSGTFVIEGALLAAGRAPGQSRDFAFRRWPHFREGLWRNLLDRARREARPPDVDVYGSDAFPEAIANARRNATRAGCAELVRFEVMDLDRVARRGGEGLIICNPPYGLRLGDDSELVDLYRKIGRLYAEEFRGWQGALLTPSPELAAATGLVLKPVATLVNGGVTVELHAGRL